MTYTDVTNKRKRNPTDATSRNTRASKARDLKLSTRVKRIEGFLKLMLPGWAHYVKHLK